jgi:transposase-like protein
MKRKRHNPEQIIRKLRSAEQLLNQGQTVADVCRALEVSAATYHRWQQLYGGMKATEAKRAADRIRKLIGFVIPYLGVRMAVPGKKPFSKVPI